MTAGDAYARALALFVADRRTEALAAFDAVLAAEPRHRAARLNRGVLLHRFGRDAEALADFDALVALAPDDPTARFNRAAVRLRLGRTAEAAADLDRAAELDPDAVDIRTRLVQTRLDLGDPEAALADAETGLARIDAAALHNARGNALAALGRLAEAEAAFAAATARDPALRDAHHNLGLVRDDLGRPAEALDAYAAAAALDAADPQPRYCAALSRLTLGELAAAWPDFRLRHARPGAPAQRHTHLPEWRGQPLDAPLLLVSEQGFGDTLLFARFAAEAAARAGSAILEVPAPLLPLLEGIPGTTVTDRFAAEAAARCALPDLPGALGIATLDDLAAFPAAYLAPPADRVAAWNGRLGPAAGPRIGLVWRGRAETRTAPHLTRALPLAVLLGALPPDAEILPLQPVDDRADAATLAADPRVRPAAPADFADTAALAALCDLAVGADSGPVHAALASGAETWILPPFSPDWRWGLARETTPWYPAARLLRQATPGLWPLAALKRALLERFR